MPSRLGHVSLAPVAGGVHVREQRVSVPAGIAHILQDKVPNKVVWELAQRKFPFRYLL
jgi:hypothetical protein